MKIIYLSLGFISFGLALLGAALPVLPTVPFLLLSSIFFSKGSDRFTLWFKSTKLYRAHLEEFEKSRSMTFMTKIKILLFASIMLLIPFIKTESLHLRLFIIGLVIFKYYYFIFRIKTIYVEGMEIANDDKQKIN